MRMYGCRAGILISRWKQASLCVISFFPRSWFFRFGRFPLFDVSRFVYLRWRMVFHIGTVWCLRCSYRFIRLGYYIECTVFCIRDTSICSEPDIFVWSGRLFKSVVGRRNCNPIKVHNKSVIQAAAHQMVLFRKGIRRGASSLESSSQTSGGGVTEYSSSCSFQLSVQFLVLSVFILCPILFNSIHQYRSCPM